MKIFILQDFECDLQVERNSESGEEKKEFSFTFYDLDGYGKITKDVSRYFLSNQPQYSNHFHSLLNFNHDPTLVWPGFCSAILFKTI